MVNSYPRKKKICVLSDGNQHSSTGNSLLLTLFRAGLNTTSPVVEVLHMWMPEVKVSRLCKGNCQSFLSPSQSLVSASALGAMVSNVPPAVFPYTAK